MLLHICNTLHIRVENFLTHPDIELTSIQILHPEEWRPIRFRYDRIEDIRLNLNLSKAEFIRRINLAGYTNITRNTYNLLVSGQHSAYPTLLGLIEATDAHLDELFEQEEAPAKSDCVAVPRKAFDEMKGYIQRLENTIRELELKNKRLEKMALPRYQERRENLDAEKVINSFIRKMEKGLIELKSWTKEEATKQPSKPYGETEDLTCMAAEEERPPYGRE